MDFLFAAFVAQMFLYLTAIARVLHIAIMVRRIGRQWPLPYYLIAIAALIMTARRLWMWIIYPPMERIDVFSYAVIPMVAAVLFFLAVEILSRRVKRLLSLPEILEDMHNNLTKIFHGKL